jgi:hypothetical protein
VLNGGACPKRQRGVDFVGKAVTPGCSKKFPKKRINFGAVWRFIDEVPYEKDPNGI